MEAKNRIKLRVSGKDGDKYVPFEKRVGDASIVYFTRNSYTSWNK